MKTLLLMRHAKSSWSNSRLADHDRPLNERGRSAAAAMGEWLTQQDVIPEVILCSTAERAKQTVEYLLQTMPFVGEVVYSRMLYHAGDEAFSEEMSKLGDDLESAMIVGHNPGMEDAVENYCAEWHRMPTAAVARIEFPITKWSQIMAVDEGELVDLWRPKEVD